MSQKGNILFLILIAVALFAALSYAVTGSTRSSANGVSSEKAELEVGRMMQYAASIENAITKLRLINKCAEGEISWQSPQWPNQTKYENTRSPVDESCHIYSANGGGVSWQNVPNAIMADPYIGVGGTQQGLYAYDMRRHIVDIGTPATFNTGYGNDLMLRAEVSEEACSIINEKTRSTPVIPTDDWAYAGVGWDLYNTSAQTTLGSSTRCPECRGHRVMCFLQINAGSGIEAHQFYYVLMAR